MDIQGGVTVEQVLSILGDFVFSAVFLWLFWTERREHLGSLRAHLEDLREMVGLRHQRLGEVAGREPPDV